MGRDGSLVMQIFITGIDGYIITQNGQDRMDSIRSRFFTMLIHFYILIACVHGLQWRLCQVVRTLSRRCWTTTAAACTARCTVAGRNWSTWDDWRSTSFRSSFLRGHSIVGRSSNAPLHVSVFDPVNYVVFNWFTAKWPLFT